jgi:hypothetical protein
MYTSNRARPFDATCYVGTTSFIPQTGKRRKRRNDENSYSQKLKLAQSQRVAKNGLSQISQISWAPAAAGGASREKLGIYQVDIITRQSSKVREAELCVLYIIHIPRLTSSVYLGHQYMQTCVHCGLRDDVLRRLFVPKTQI